MRRPSIGTALFALYAFNIEIARVREIVHEPLAGEIRLQWWSDMLEGERARARPRRNPVAAALTGTVARYPSAGGERLRAVIAARRFDLYNEPMASLGDLEAYAEGASGGLIAVGGADPRRWMRIGHCS